MPHTFREFLKRLMTDSADPIDPNEPSAGPDNLPRELEGLEAGSADADLASDPHRAGITESAPRESSPAANRPDQESRTALPGDSPVSDFSVADSPVSDSAGTLPPEPTGSEIPARFVPGVETATLPRPGFDVAPAPVAGSFELPGSLPSSDRPAESPLNVTLPLPADPIDHRASGPLSMSMSPAQVAGLDRSVRNIPPADESPRPSLARDDDSFAISNQSPDAGRETGQSARLDTVLDALDRQVQRGESGQSRVLERLDELLERTRAAHAEQMRLEGRIDQLEAAHLLRGRL